MSRCWSSRRGRLLSKVRHRQERPARIIRISESVRRRRGAERRRGASAHARDACLKGSRGANRHRAEPERHEQGDQRDHERCEPDGPQQATQTDARSVKRNDFAVCRHAAEPDQDADKDRHRQRENQDRRQRAKEEQRDRGQAARVPDDQVHPRDELRHEEHEGEDGHSQAVNGWPLRGKCSGPEGAWNGSLALSPERGGCAGA